jgi:hypothetical protein
MQIASFPKFRAFDANGQPLAGGKLYAYAAGTTTLKDTYADIGGTLNPNPVLLDANGEADLWLGAGAYKLKLTDSDDAQQWVVDNISSLATSAELCAAVEGFNDQFNLIGTEDTRPTPDAGTVIGLPFLATDTGKIYRWDGTQWLDQTSAMIPTPALATWRSTDVTAADITTAIDFKTIMIPANTLKDGSQIRIRAHVLAKANQANVGLLFGGHDKIANIVGNMGATTTTANVTSINLSFDGTVRNVAGVWTLSGQCSVNMTDKAATIMACVDRTFDPAIGDIPVVLSNWQALAALAAYFSVSVIV